MPEDPSNCDAIRERFINFQAAVEKTFPFCGSKCRKTESNLAAIEAFLEWGQRRGDMA